MKKTCLKDYSRPRSNGINAINIREDDRVVSVELTNGTDEIVIANRGGRAIRFNETVVRAMGRTATGVRGIRLDEGDDEVIGMVCVNNPEAETILVVSENGYGKKSAIEDYRITNRGGKGVRTLNVTDKTGPVAAIKCVTDQDDLMIINKSGTALRLKTSTIRTTGRATQGVKLTDLAKRGDTISSVCKVPTAEEEPETPETNEVPNAPEATANDAQQ